MPVNTVVLRNVAEPYRAPASWEPDCASAAVAVLTILRQSSIRSRLKRQLIDIVLWKYTEAAGMRPHAKYNLRFVSDGARDLDTPALVNHEHVHTRKWMLDKIFAREHWEDSGLADFLAVHAVACVVTLEEHALLGESRLSGWARYQDVGVRVWDRAGQVWFDGHSTPDAGAASEEVARPESDQHHDVHVLLAERARQPELMERLLRSARYMGAVAVASTKRDGSLSDYFRLYDAQAASEQGVMAYPHWSGRVDFRITKEALPQELAERNEIRSLAQDDFAIAVTVTDERSLALAEELLFLTLDKLRSEGDDTV